MSVDRSRWLPITAYQYGDDTRIGRCGIPFRNRSWYFDCGTCRRFRHGYPNQDAVMRGFARHNVLRHSADLGTDWHPEFSYEDVP